MSTSAVVGLGEFTRELEELEVALQLEYYNQYAGLPYSEGEMSRLAAAIEAMNREGLQRFPEDALPRLLWFSMLRGAEAGAFTRLENESYRLRNEAVAVDVEGERVNLNNVRTWNFRHLRDHDKRKRAFDGLMDAAAKLTPTLKERFGLSARVYGEHGLTPLDVYCEEERLTVDELANVVDESARRARPEFERLADELSPQVIGKPMEYFDDMYVYRASVYNPVDAAFRGVDFVAGMKQVAANLGFDADLVAIDGAARAGKYASPVCFGIRIPGDVRVLYQETSPFGDYESFYHEMGHGLHFVSVDADRPYEERRLIPNGVAELFSTLFEEVALDPAFLREDVGLADDVVEEVVRRRRFMELFFLTFYGANGMHKVRFWRDGLVADFDAADNLYADLTERYMGVRVPGRYWQTHHILSMSDVYAPSYLLANIRKSELRRLLERRFGPHWWRDPDAGDFLRRDCMGPGAAIDLGAFSRLDADAYVAHVVSP